MRLCTKGTPSRCGLRHGQGGREVGRCWVYPLVAQRTGLPQRQPPLDALLVKQVIARQAHNWLVHHQLLEADAARVGVVGCGKQGTHAHPGEGGAGGSPSLHACLTQRAAQGLRCARQTPLRATKAPPDPPHPSPVTPHPTPHACTHTQLLPTPTHVVGAGAARAARPRWPRG